jgi:hypothetical protein
MMEQQKYGIHRKENYNIHYKHILIKQNFQDKEIILLVVDLINLLMYGNVDFMIV